MDAALLLLTACLITGYALARYLSHVKSNGEVMSTWLVTVLLCFYYKSYLLLKLNVLARLILLNLLDALSTYLLSNSLKYSFSPSNIIQLPSVQPGQVES
jgi:hypothetical protein